MGTPARGATRWADGVRWSEMAQPADLGIVAAPSSRLPAANRCRTSVSDLRSTVDSRARCREHANAAVRIKWWPETGRSVMHTNPQTGLNEHQRIHALAIAP